MTFLPQKLSSSVSYVYFFLNNNIKIFQGTNEMLYTEGRP